MSLDGLKGLFKPAIEESEDGNDIFYSCDLFGIRERIERS